MSVFKCRSCGQMVHESKAKDFSKLSDFRCGSCWTVLASLEYPVNIKGAKTAFSAGGIGLGDNTLFEVVKREYLKANPDEEVIFLYNDTDHRKSIAEHKPDKYFLNEFKRDDVDLNYKGLIRYNMINEVCAYADRGIYPEFIMGLVGVDKLMNIDYVALHIRDIEKAPEKNVTQDELDLIIEAIPEKHKLVIIGNDANNLTINREHIDLRHKLCTSQVGWVCKNAVTFIGNDSGVVHLAASVGAKIFSWGFNSEKWFPKTDLNHFVAYTSIFLKDEKYELNQLLESWFRFGLVR